MRGRLRVRHLTLPPAYQLEPVIDGGISDAQRFLNQERMESDGELIVAATSKDRPHVHAVEEWRRSWFWATSDSEESSVEEDGGDQSLDTPEFVDRAHEVGFSTQDLVKVGKEVEMTSYAKLENNSMAKTIVQALVHHKGIKPWIGRLPKRRNSTPMTLEAAMAKAKVLQSLSSSSLSLT